MKVAFVASVFIGDSIDKSMPYILQVAKNIEKINRMRSDWDLFVHTDEVTKEALENVCSSECIRTNKVKFVVHRRNAGMRGMMWRYEAFFMDGLGYDVSVVLEGDQPLEKYAGMVGAFSRMEHQMLLFDVRQMAVNMNCIAGGMILIRPSLVKDGYKQKLRRVMDLMDHVDEVDYGVDENALLMWLKKHFKNEKVLIVVDDKHKTFQHIENVEAEKRVVRSNFPGATIMDIREFENIANRCVFEHIDQVTLKNLDNDVYRFNGRYIKLGGWWRSPKNEKLHALLVDVIDKMMQ